MNMNIFLPPLDSRWRLAGDWIPNLPFLDRSDNTETIWGTAKYGGIGEWQKATGDNTNGEAHGPGGWVERYHTWQAAEKARIGTPQFVTGTVFQIERYHVSRSGEDQITVKVLVSPEKRLTPKKQGGTMRGAGRLYLTLAEFNSLPSLETVEDMP